MNPPSKRILSVFAALGFCAAISTATAQTTVTTDPVGFMTTTIAPGYQTLGLPLIQPAIAAAAVQTSSSNSVTDTTGTTNYGALLQSSTSSTATQFFLEITGSASASGSTACIGERFDVDVANTIAAGTNTVVLLNNANATVALPLPNLSGYSFAIRAHLTLGAIFGANGTSPFQGSTNPSTADQVQIWNPATQSYSVYFLLQSGTNQHWRMIGGGATVYDAAPIPTGCGVFFLRSGTTNVTLTSLGGVRTSSFADLPLISGYNFVSLPFPVDQSPSSLQITGSTGFTGNNSSSLADQIQIWNPTTQGYNVYFLTASGQWRLIGGGTTNYSATTILSSGSGAFIRCANPQPNFAVARPF